MKSRLFSTENRQEPGAARPSEQSGRGRFIVIEGLDGSGKSTQITRLVSGLRAAGRPVHQTAEPTSAATGGLIRDALSNNYRRDPYELAALFLADRISHNVNPVYGIGQFLEKGTSVVCDRYYYSSFAYQGISVDLDWVMDANLGCPKIIKPDLCVFLDMDVETCLERMARERTHREIFETDADMMRRIRQRFYDVFERLGPTESIFVVDAGRPPDDVAGDILAQALSLFS